MLNAGKPDHDTLIRASYAAFNAGDMEAAAACLAPDVVWPNQLDGGTINGREAVVAYWKRLAQVHRHQYEVIQCKEDVPGIVKVSLVRTVEDLAGTVLSKGLLHHRHTFRDGLVVHMEFVI